MTSYAKDDIRSQLASVPPPQVTIDPATPISRAQYLEFTELAPTAVSPAGSRTWVARGQNVVLVWTDAVAGDRFSREGQPDEYAVLMHSGSASLRVTAGGDRQEVAEEAFVVVPPGDSAIEALTDGPVIRLFSAVAEDLGGTAVNSDVYAGPDPRCAPLVPWPDPVGGFRLRVYRLADTPISEGRFGRIFRTTNLMVNFLAEEPTPRNPIKLSPHSHDDFEQLSLAVEGEFIHHIQYPWGPDSTQWRPEEHGRVGSPSITVIPPPAVHTTQGVGSHQQLIDIFSPPRQDFSARPGWILNEADYPAR
ncbi:hypothetical protein ACFFS2_09135 [Streptomyces aurantiacus]|uniref:Uncharacterized protein n=1 Tax=Streptomyces aurantiacus TaxID=47760 RepID=A0A7G1NSE1_9ACTN|nr:hypothetical protein [Streptomyces aurantiacus]BCL25452.1 hypothetical protein GCM10017557_03110 [Streptomyces aurantiacus]